MVNDRRPRWPGRRFLPGRPRGAGACSVRAAMPAALRRRVVFLLAFLGVLGVGRAARAATYPCSEAGLDAALAAGGDASFGCAAATTIVLAQPKTITRSGTNLDGGGTFILSGNDAVVPLTVVEGVTASITRFTITSGHGTSEGYGGNLVVRGTLTMTDSVSRDGGSYAGGSGIFVASGGVLSMNRSLVTGARAVDGGDASEGSIAVHGLATITNSTVTGSGLRGITSRFSGALTLTSSTVVTTQRQALFAIASTAMQVTASLLVTPPGVPSAQLDGTLTSGGYNLLTSATVPPNRFDAPTDIVGVRPLLGPLASNGGSTQTHALLECSPGINAGPTASALTTDQRGSPRVARGAADIGAHESSLLPCVRPGDTATNEGNAGTSAATFRLALSGRSTIASSVDYVTLDGDATTADTDYVAAAGTVTFAPGELAKNVTVLVNGDTRNEKNETFSLFVTPTSSASVADYRGEAIIINDDDAPSFAVGDVSVAEGDVGTTSATVTVTLSAASGQTVTVGYATANATATAGSDYVATSGTLTFPPGTTTRTFTVMANGDRVHEGNETFRVQLSAPTNATLARATATCTILDNEATPGLVVGDASAVEGNEGETPVALTVVLGTASSTPVTVDWATVDGTATAADGDYTAASGTLTFAPGETSKTVTVAVLGDTAVEADETFIVRLANATGAEISTADGITTITNDDVAPPVLDAGTDAPVDAAPPAAPDASVIKRDSGVSFPGTTFDDDDGGCAVAALGAGDAGSMVGSAVAGLAVVLAARRRRRR